MIYKVRTIALLSAIAVLAACSSVNLEAPTGVDRGQWDGAGAQ